MSWTEWLSQDELLAACAVALLGVLAAALLVMASRFTKSTPAPVRAPVEPKRRGTMKSIEEIREALARIHRYAMKQSKDAYMSVPPNPDKDADLIVGEAITELETLRREVSANRSRTAKLEAQLNGWAKLLGLTDYYTCETGFFHALSDQGREQALEKSTLGQKLKRLEQFKAYVHKRLDDAGVPVDPNPEETKTTGCRVGPRLDSAFKELGLLHEFVGSLAHAKGALDGLRKLVPR